jgi:hypothetical protein
MARTATPAPPQAAVPAPPAAITFEVATTSADALRASVRTAGALTRPACSVLRSVLAAHLRAGRRYLRVDVGGSDVLESDVLDALTETHHQIAEQGGMLVFENAGPRVIEAVRAAATLFVHDIP